MARLCLCVSENPSTAVPYVFPNLISTCLSIAGSALHFTPHTFLGAKSKPTLVKSPTFLNMHWASSEITYQIQLCEQDTEMFQLQKDIGVISALGCLTLSVLRETLPCTDAV